MPKISVVVPCYHVEQYLPQIQKDLMSQTFTDFEILYINDGGGNNLSAIIHKFADEVEKVRAIDKPNGGVSSARNLGIDLAKGEWLVFVDADDHLSPDYLKQLYDSVNGSKSNLAVAGFYQKYTTTGHTIDYSIDIEGKDIDIKTAYFHFPPFNAPWNKIFKTQFLRDSNLRFPEGVSYLEDEHFCLLLFNKIDTCCLVKNCGYTYMMNDTNSAVSRHHDNLKVYMQTSKFLRNQLLRKFDKTEGYIKSLDIDSIGIDLYILIINLFKIGTHLTTRDAYNYIKNEIFGDKNFMRLLKSHSFSKDKLQVKVCDMLLCTKSPLLVTLVFKLLFWIKYHRPIKA